ncbi:MAG TPA: hypothetical protein VMU84_15535 [Thermoanaerobaculia bacterium]|nr:hypothetical protein [Thermoanaerobaculia bacterium]
MSSTDSQRIATPLPKAPYRGIEEFRCIDSAIFFGRDSEGKTLLRLITMYRGVLLYGDSGAGKSSLINAKLIPMAMAEQFAPERVRVQPKLGEEFIVERIAIAEEGSALLPTIFSDGDGSPRISFSAAAFVQRVIERCHARIDGDGIPQLPAQFPLLVFDQFEELVTLSEQFARETRSTVAYEAYASITRALLELLQDESLCLKMLFVFREDYYAKLSKFFALHPGLTNHFLRIEPLHTSQLHTIIAGPFETIAFDHVLPANVIASLERELRERSDSDLINLSEVQIASLRLWNSSEPMKLLEEQHVAGLLESYFSAAIDALPPLHQQIAYVLLGRMVTDSGTRNVVSTEDLVASVEGERVDRRIAFEVLDALTKSARVIRRERRSDVLVYEIVSEYLVPWIRRRKLEEQAARERRAEYERELQSRKRRWKWIAVSMLVVSLLVVGAMAIEIYRRSSTELFRSREEAVATAKRLTSQQKDLLRIQESLREELTNTKASVTRTQRALENALFNMVEERQRADTNQRLLAGARARIVVLDRELAMIRTQLEHSEGESQTLKKDIDALKKENDSLKKENESLKKRVEALQQTPFVNTGTYGP